MNKMKWILMFFLSVPLFLKAQDKEGILFEKGLDWDQIKAKARDENKYIFVDCYTTWCGPCKQMDKFIYPNDTVGNFINDKYISVKVQIDTTKNDNDEIKRWYGIGHSFIEDYNIPGFPTFLFFSPEGKIVHKEIGYKTVKQFISMASDALQVNKQFYTLIQEYKRGKLDYMSMKKFSSKAKEMGDEKLAFQISDDYLHNYLYKQPLNEIATKENLDFINSNYKGLSTQDRVFDLYYNYPEIVDSVMKKKGTAKSYAYYIIFKEQVSTELDNAKAKKVNPKWKEISKQITSKYPKINVVEMITNAKVSWYKYKRDWKNYCKYVTQQVDNTGIENYPADLSGIMALNGNAWNIFLHSNNKKELSKALTWANRAIELDPKPSPAVMDTKANLMYKLGRKKEAIELYRKVVELEPGFKKTLDKMEKGLPTWILENENNL